MVCYLADQSHSHCSQWDFAIDFKWEQVFAFKMVYFTLLW